MSNIGNVFGNRGWIQSSIDKSRGKTRPGERDRRAASSDAARRDAALAADPLLKKYEPTGVIESPKTRVMSGLAGLLRRSILVKNDPLVKKYGG